MKNQTRKDVIPFSVSSAAFPAERSLEGILSIPASQYRASPKFRQSKVGSVIKKMNRFGEEVDNLAQGIREHVKIGSKLTETVKGKLSLGAKILKVGGVKKVFKQNFSVKEGEKLLKVSQCYLSTSAGPLAGLLFISSEKIAFCSERSIRISSQAGDFLRPGCDPTKQDKECQRKRKSEAAINEVYRNTHKGQFRLLVYGIS